MDTLGKEQIHIPDEKKLDSARFHHTVQNGAQFKTYKVFISEIFHLLFSDHGWPWVTETTEIETANKGEPMSFYLLCILDQSLSALPQRQDVTRASTSSVVEVQEFECWLCHFPTALT